MEEAVMRHRFETRLRQLEALDPTQAWLTTDGLAALLAYARRHRPQPWDRPEVDPEDDQGSFGRLLAKARQWQHREEAYGQTKSDES
jgi:hypothetical protein